MKVDDSSQVKLYVRRVILLRAGTGSLMLVQFEFLTLKAFANPSPGLRFGNPGTRPISRRRKP